MTSRLEPSSPLTPSVLSWGDIMDEVDPLPSSPLDPYTITSGSIGNTVDPVPSSLVTPSSPSWGDIMDEVDPLPSSPLSPSALTWDHIMKMEETKLKVLKEHKEQTEEAVKQEEKIEGGPKWKVKAIMEGEKKSQEVEEKKENDKVSRDRKKQIQEVKEKKNKDVIMERKKQIQKVEEKKKNEKVGRNKPCHSKSTKTFELCIRNLDYRVDEEWLYEEFLPFGDIISSKVKTEDGRSRGIGFVQFSSVREAMAAMAEMNGVMLGRRPIYISLSKNR